MTMQNITIPQCPSILKNIEIPTPKPYISLILISRNIHQFYQYSCFNKDLSSYFTILQECTQKHLAHKWCSQPLLNRRLHGGDLQIASAILTSGNNYAKLKLFADFLKLYFPSVSKYSAIQRTYLIPTINTVWREEQTHVIDSLHGREVIALGMYFDC
jgi:hypothetical protein